MLNQKEVLRIKANLESFSKTYDIAYEIYANGKILVHYMPIHFPKDKENWLRRKRNTSKLFEADSLAVFNKNLPNLDNFYKKYGVSEEDYALTGGSVCIKNDDGLVIGYVTVTGLSPEEDHRLGEEAIKKIR